EELTAGSVLRPFTLVGSYDGVKINNCTVNARHTAYLWDADTDTFNEVAFSAENIVGNFAELYSVSGGSNVDGVLIVATEDSEAYWDSDMYWLTGVGAGTDPSVDDTTGEAVFSADYAIPMGERLLTGYGLGDWSGTTDFSNIIDYGDETGESLEGDLNYYWPQHDYYNAKSNTTLTMLTNYKTALQATGSNCGPTSALTVLEWFNEREDLNEEDLVALREKSTWGGSTVLEQMQNIFENLADLGITDEWEFQSSYTNPGQLFDHEWIEETLASGSPIMVGWNSFGGHWQVIIGYDNMGTHGTADDVLILMDPYDTTDHRNDGYNIQSYERLAYGVQSFDDDNELDNEDVNYSGTLFLVATPAEGWSYDGPDMYDGSGYTISTTSAAMDFGATYGATVEDNWINYRDTADDIQTYYQATEIWGTGSDGLAGPATGSYRHTGDVENSSYYSHFNIYDIESDTNPNLILLEKFNTTQQTTEWTCGLASALMNIEWFGENDDNFTEIDLAQMRQDVSAGATTVNEMEDVFSKLNTSYGEDWAWFTMRDLDAGLSKGGHSLEYGADDGGLIPYLLSQGIPMMIGWDEWGGHWQVIVGYDDMGTYGTQDDVLILADPYDTTDHNQDGYYLESFERLVYGWDAQFDEDYAFIVAFPTTAENENGEYIIDELGLTAPYFTPAPSEE
ncbi:MAG TPA: papain-like cysteine protease family protein, partial [Anaerovoracaceae bacterium]|nr:papain-like cysteine protease family protein [Anaerovoracaceae bacterium]